MPTGSAAELRAELTASVSRHIMSEVPYGLLLSGGLDSSLIAAIACREYKRLGNADALRSFCIGLEGSPDIKGWFEELHTWFDDGKKRFVNGSKNTFFPSSRVGLCMDRIKIVPNAST